LASLAPLVSTFRIEDPGSLHGFRIEDPGFRASSLKRESDVLAITKGSWDKSWDKSWEGIWMLFLPPLLLFLISSILRWSRYTCDRVRFFREEDGDREEAEEDVEEEAEEGDKESGVV
jgi:hypothetical protein